MSTPKFSVNKLKSQFPKSQVYLKCHPIIIIHVVINVSTHHSPKRYLTTSLYSAKGHSPPSGLLCNSASLLSFSMDVFFLAGTWAPLVSWLHWSQLMLPPPSWLALCLQRCFDVPLKRSSWGECAILPGGCWCVGHWSWSSSNLEVGSIYPVMSPHSVCHTSSSFQLQGFFTTEMEQYAYIYCLCQ